MTVNKEKHKVWEHLFPSADSEVTRAIDRQSMRNIRNVSLAACIFEALSILVFMTVDGWKFEGSTFASLYSVGFCVVFSLIVFLFSKNMMKNKELSHGHSLIFKFVFFGVYTVWGIFADMRHYAVGDQMLTFFTVQLLFTCFIMFKPYISIVLVSAAYAGFYAAAYHVRQAAGIEIYNFVLLAILSAVGMCVQYHTHLYMARKEQRLQEASHRDALTGLRNRMALEEDIKGICGTAIAAYMIDIDCFKEFNDHYGHVTGDEILKETGSVLQKLYPNAFWYRYGGDEFLVLSTGGGPQNYEGSEYSFIKQSPDGTYHVSLSIGSAKGKPQSYDEAFDLISKADAALYETKVRTHSPEYGGHDRRQRRR